MHYSNCSIANKLFRSLSYGLSAGAHIHQLSKQQGLEFGDSIEEFAHQLVLQYLDFLDTTPLEDVLSDCEALSQSSAALCQDIGELGESEELSKARELHHCIAEDLVVLKDTWLVLVQGCAVLRQAYNNNSLLCLK